MNSKCCRHHCDLPLVDSNAEGANLIFDDGDTQVQRTITDGGTRVITQRIPATRSASVSLWMPVGSRDETVKQAGSTHFLEHLLFKGTKSRSSFDISYAFDAVGGETNAETGKETTNYWARILGDDLDMAIEVLTDMLSSSLLDASAFELERKVILDELAMSQDNPTEVLHEIFARAIFGESALGRPVGGTTESIAAVSRDDVWDYYQRTYDPSALIIAATGAIDHDHVVETVGKAISVSEWAHAPIGVTPRPRRMANQPFVREEVDQCIDEVRDIEQAHILVGGRSLPKGDPRRPVLSILLSILGGSVSSRLFQEVREKRGLAYTTYAFDMPYSDCGAFGMYAGTSRKCVREVEKVMSAQLEDLAENGPTESELARVRGQLRGATALGLENNYSRMVRLGRCEILGDFISLDDALDEIDAVSSDDVRLLAEELYGKTLYRARVLPK